MRRRRIRCPVVPPLVCLLVLVAAGCGDEEPAKPGKFMLPATP